MIEVIIKVRAENNRIKKQNKSNTKKKKNRKPKADSLKLLK